MYKLILFSILTTTCAVHADNPVRLLRRQTVDSFCSSQDQKCGAVCIDLTDTCCPDAAGGCPLGTYCSLGSNGDYGCCDNGETCKGPGGAFTTPGDIIFSTHTILVFGEPTDTSVLVVPWRTDSTRSPPPVSSSFPSSVSRSSKAPPILTVTATTTMLGSTGAASRNIQSLLPMKLFAFVLPLFAI
jgi:hypothetical protein